MKFFSLESSKKLAERGCVSDNMFYYASFNMMLSDPPQPQIVKIYNPTLHEKQHAICQAFTTFDFLSSEEYALENCRKLWPQKMDWNYNNPICSHCKTEGNSTFWHINNCYEAQRIKMLDAPDQIKFVEEYLK